MKRRIIYVPLEPYKERYTYQLSAPKIGWLERNWINFKIDYIRIEGQSLTNTIQFGSVLDACGRGYWACFQIAKLLEMLNKKEITEEDVIYFDDFWHPGISALPYAFHLLNIKPKMYAMLHAQSIDIYDFTYSMRHWMRHFEIGIGKILDGIFVTSTCLKDLCLYAGIGNSDTVHITGLPYNSEEVKERFTANIQRKKQVIYSSRWDKEKCPDFFLKVVEYCLQRRRDIIFVITTSSKKLRSNSFILLDSLNRALEQYPKNLILQEGLSKEEYYRNLLESKIQINTANQDFVSWTLLEATTAGCRPLYPYYLSFPEALGYRDDLMYIKGDIKDAGNKILKYIDVPIQEDYKWIYQYYDTSWKRMFDIMNQ